MLSVLSFPFQIAKAMLLFPVHLLIGSFRREKPGDSSGVWSASMGGGQSRIYVGRMGVLPSMLLIALITSIVLVMFVVAGAALVVLSPVIIVSKVLPHRHKPAAVLDDSIPTTGRVQLDEPATHYLPPSGNAGSGR